MISDELQNMLNDRSQLQKTMYCIYCVPFMWHVQKSKPIDTEAPVGLSWWLMEKNLPEMQETWVWFLGQEDPLDEGMATHFSILAWEIPGTEEPGGYSP